MKTQINTALSFILMTVAFASTSQDALYPETKTEEHADDIREERSLFSQNDKGVKGEDYNSGRFSAINLDELRRTVLNQLIKDDLINSKKAKVYLFLKEDGITFNDQKLDKELNAKYTRLLAPYEIGTGPDRTIFLSKDCTAVGDFKEDAFHGKMQGRLRIEYTKRPFEF